MYHLKLPSQILILFVMLLCVSTVPYNRYSLPFNEKPDDLQEADGWLVTDLSDNPFLSFTRPRPPSGLPAVNSHHMEKRNCNTATCVTQRLADFLIRSSNTIGTVYVPTNVGANTYGKRDLLQSAIYLPL
ncbi:calcitonin gene-related peptide 2-like [Carassius carassius]|uniref:calcitonin gene-related peptide 2-like n=1 Tax=Carassius carassius TaxID=217509 RepID=UPI002868A556|nr:calcitonin gene-related peptide 2-like [Carassius carassius]XP_059360513.1 calcitonin gene-related peptide 2-like [Carassius carassius]